RLRQAAPGRAARRRAPAAGDRGHPRRRGRPPGRVDPGRGRRRPGRGRAGRPGDRQLEPRQDRPLRPRPQLGPDRPVGRRRAGRCRDGRNRRRLDRRRRARRRLTRGRDPPPTPPGRRPGARLFLRPRPRVRDPERGIHDVTERAPQSRAAATSVETLLEALPYIREFHGRTVVIKYGGAAMLDEGLRDAFAADVVLLKYVGLNPIVVHGGGPEITRYMDKLGLEVQSHEGLRVSDADTGEIAKMVLVGKLNSEIVQRLNRHGSPAVGLSGEDGTLFEVAPAAKADRGRLGGTVH